MKKIAIFASGGGSNAKAIIQHFLDKKELGEVVVLVSNNSDAGALVHAENHGIKTKIFNKSVFKDSPTEVLDYLENEGVDLIALAGFMLFMPKEIVAKYSDRIVNIHPSLLPKFGGKGMYGMNVHRAVIEARETTSGITIHMVNEEYDKGRVLFQTSTPIYIDDTPETLAERILALEHLHYPQIIAKTLNEI